MFGIGWELCLTLFDHVLHRATGIMLKMPFRRHDMRQKPIEFRRIGNHFGKKQPHIPLDQYPANIENDCCDLCHRADFRQQKTARESSGAVAACAKRAIKAESALACLKATVGFVDHIGASTTANHAVVAVAALKRFQRIDDFHRICP